DHVGRDGLDEAVGAQDHPAVAHAWGLLGGGLLGDEGELAVVDHPGELLEDVEVGALELARAPPDGKRRLAGENAEDRVVPAHGNALQAGAVAGLGLALAVDDLARAPGLRQQWTLRRLEHPPD